MRLLTSAKKSRSQPQPESKSGSNPGPDTAGAPNSVAATTVQPTVSILPLLSMERTRAKISVTSRKRALEHACEILAGCNDLDARSVLDALLAREKLGSTALGEGVAIPHCRLSDCQTPVGVLLTLENPIDYDAPDDNPVDLLFALVVPESANDEHLQILSQLAGILVEQDNRDALREARDHLPLFDRMLALVTSSSTG